MTSGSVTSAAAGSASASSDSTLIADGAPCSLGHEVAGRLRMLEEVLEHLPGGVVGQGVDELHVLGDLEAGERLAREAAYRVGVERGAGVQHDERLHLMAEQLMGHADHRDLGDLGVLQESVLDLGGIDVLAAPDDEVAAPAFEVHEAVGDVAE